MLYALLCYKAVCVPQAFALNIVSQTNEQWKKLIQKQADAGSLDW